ncbi:MAG: TVP38/TMEM64 family protein [Cyanothece sp. SIO1E1]|nr:TVP38/TMEM64 family protein [Cyanothece sp. SIO1E1]
MLPLSTKFVKTRLIINHRFWVIVALVALLLLCVCGPLSILFDQDALEIHLDRLGPLGMLLFIMVHIMATVLGVPGAVLVIAGGGVFGFVLGTVLSVVGATLGAIAAFLVARHLLKDWFERRLAKHTALNRLRKLMGCNTVNCVLAIRFAPISPFNIVNFWFGLTSIHLRPYAIGTGLGIIPGTMAYTWLGVAGMEAMHGEGVFHLALASSFLVLLSVLPILARNRKQKQKH